jgi:hypothetical protein
MPKRPDRSEYQARHQRRIFGLQLRESKPAPAGFLTEPNEEKNKRKRSGNSRSFSICQPETFQLHPKLRVIATAMRQISAGAANVTRYHLSATRQRTRRLKNSRKPDRPETIAVTIIPATNGPSGFGPLVRPRINAMTHDTRRARMRAQKTRPICAASKKLSRCC